MDVFGQSLQLKKLGIDTYKEAVIYMRKDCHICRSEGFEAQARIQVMHENKIIIATLNTIDTNLLSLDEASLSNYAWDLLQVKEGDKIFLSHPKPLTSLSYIRSKVYGNELKKTEIENIIKDVTAGYLSDVHIAAFLAASAGERLNQNEICALTASMVQVGDHLTWSSKIIVDKHCIGGLPGNRTSLIIVPIVTAFGLTMPKTSSRAITSPAGTADTMEVLAPVDLNLKKIKQVVEQENGCIVWGGLAALSPADDILIRVEKAIDLDGEGQLVASILSKKIASGTNHIVIDLPIGPTAKVRTLETAELLKKYFIAVGTELGLTVRIIFTDGMQPVGRGIGPCLEAKDVLAVLRCEKNAPQDLRNRALSLAGEILEFSADIKPGTGKQIATKLLNTGKAWKKFQAICEAQGGMFEPKIAPYTFTAQTKKPGKISSIDNRRLARLAKLAGAPISPAAGIEMLTTLGAVVEKNQPLFVIHAQTRGELDYAITFLENESEIIQVKENA